MTSSGFCCLALDVGRDLGPGCCQQRAAGDRRRDVLARGLHVVQQRGELRIRIGHPPLLLDDELAERGSAMMASSCSCRALVRVQAWPRPRSAPARGGARANTRLARMSSAVIVCSASRVDRRRAPANRRFAWRSRARSSALRIERALAKFGLRHAAHDVVAHRRLARPGRGGSACRASIRSRDREQLVGAVVGKVDVVGDARRHAGIAGEERVHPVLVAGEDHDQVVALVLHHLQQDLDRLLAVVALVLGPVQVVRLVDEQHAAHRALQHLRGLGRGVADVLADEVVAGHRDEVALADVARAGAGSRPCAARRWSCRCRGCR